MLAPVRLLLAELSESFGCARRAPQVRDQKSNAEPISSEFPDLGHHRGSTAAQSPVPPSAEAARGALGVEDDKQATKRLRVALACIGYHGDFQPLLALFFHLSAEKYDVTVFADDSHCEALKQSGIAHRSIGIGSQEFLRDPATIKALEDCDFIALQSASMVKFGLAWKISLDARLKDFAPDLVVYSGNSSDVVHGYCMRHDVPSIHLVLQPQTIPNNVYQPQGFEKLPRDPDQPVMLLWLQYLQMLSLILLATKGELNPTYGMYEPTLSSPETYYANLFHVDMAPEPKICAFSTVLFPQPEGWPAKNADILGRLELRESEFGRLFPASAPAVECCLEFVANADSPVVCISWGSAAGVLSRACQASLAVGALRKAGHCGVVLGTGLSAEGLDEDLRGYCRDHVLFLDFAPHASIFRQCCCVVHHGGVGVAQDALAAGVPMVVCPCLGDQVEVARLTEMSGWGVRVSPLPQLTADELGDAIRACSSGSGSTFRQVKNASILMSSEDGASRAAKQLERFVDEDLATGEWMKNHATRKALLRAARMHSLEWSTEQLFAQPLWTTVLAEKYPPLKTYWQNWFERYGELLVLAQQKRLWFVKGKSGCSTQHLGSGSGEDAGQSSANLAAGDGAGQFHHLAILEEIGREDGLLHVRRRRGAGPTEGWVTLEATGGDEAPLALLNNLTEIAHAVASDFKNRLRRFTNVPFP